MSDSDAVVEARFRLPVRGRRRPAGLDPPGLAGL